VGIITVPSSPRLTTDLIHRSEHDQLPALASNGVYLCRVETCISRTYHIGGRYSGFLVIRCRLLGRNVPQFLLHWALCTDSALTCRASNSTSWIGNPLCQMYLLSTDRG
jgi:hypothetical protein